MAKNKVRSGRFARASMLGGMAAGLAGDAVGAVVAKGRDTVSSELHRRAAKRLLESLGEMKGLPMKLGQMLSYVDDMVPPEHRAIYRETLEALRVRARPLDFEVMKATIEEDLGRPIDEIFASFDETPIAAASIGQVYRATLPDGRNVAVKVQYPGIERAIRSDLRNADALLSAFSVILPKVDLETTLADVNARVLEECDYVHEAESQRRFAEIYADDPDIVVPAVVDELCATRVLTSELVEGKGWDEMLTSTSSAERSRLALIIFRFVFDAIYNHAVFNADPHPGNYLFLDDGRIAFLDYGCVQSFETETLAAIVAVRDAILEGRRGASLRELLAEAYAIPEGLDDEVWEVIETYVLLSFEPLIAPQPFAYDRAYTERLTKMTLDAKMRLAKKLFSLGLQEAKRPGLVFMNRINFGLNSILSALEAKADWRAELRRIERTS